MVETNHYFTMKEFAKKADCSKEAIRQAIERGSIKNAFKLETIWLIPKTQLEPFKASKRNYPK